MKWLFYFPEIGYVLIFLFCVLKKRKTIIRAIKILLMPPALKEYLNEENKDMQEIMNRLEKRTGSISDILNKIDRDEIGDSRKNSKDD